MSAAERPTLEVGRIIKAHGLQRPGRSSTCGATVSSDSTPAASSRPDRGTLTVVAAAAAPAPIHRLLRRRRRRARTPTAGAASCCRAPRLDDETVIWIDQLFGAEVVDAAGVVRGAVVEVEANPASDLLVLDSGALVPLTFVTRVEANAPRRGRRARGALRMTLRVDVLTIFPDAVRDYAPTSVLGRAGERPACGGCACTTCATRPPTRTAAWTTRPSAGGRAW